MTHEILINVTPQETRVAMLEQGVVQELHIERSSARGLVGNICLGRVARVLPGHAERVHRDRPRARGVPAHRRHLGAPPERPRRRRAADREDPARRPVAAGAGDQGSDRHQGRAAFDAGEPRRTAARLPAAGLAHRHLAAHRRRSRARDAARAAAASAPRRAGRRLHHPHDGRDRDRARDAGRHRVPDQAVERPHACARARRRRPRCSTRT